MTTWSTALRSPCKMKVSGEVFSCGITDSLQSQMRAIRCEAAKCHHPNKMSKFNEFWKNWQIKIIIVNKKMNYPDFATKVVLLSFKNCFRYRKIYKSFGGNFPFKLWLDSCLHLIYAGYWPRKRAQSRLVLLLNDRCIFSLIDDIRTKTRGGGGVDDAGFYSIVCRYANGTLREHVKTSISPLFPF